MSILKELALTLKLEVLPNTVHLQAAMDCLLSCCTRKHASIAACTQKRFTSYKLTDIDLSATTSA